MFVVARVSAESGMAAFILQKKCSNRCDPSVMFYVYVQPFGYDRPAL